MKTLVTNLANNQVMLSFRDNETGALTGNSEFHSYGTKIAEIKNGATFLDAKSWNYSATTIKYLAKFLGLRGKKEIINNIEKGKFTLKNLNK